MSWDYLGHQILIADEAYGILKLRGLVYLAMLERTGKSGTAIKVAEISKAKNILILTKKAAISGWQEHLDNLPVTKKYTIINYESVHKLTESNYDLCVLDEAHNYLASYPKPSKTLKKVYQVVYGLPIIYTSATPSAQSYGQLYHQFKVSKWSPFDRYKDFYSFFSTHGVPEIIWISGRQVKKYDTVKESAFNMCKHLFISYTRRDLGFVHEPEPKLHYVELARETKEIYNKLQKDQILQLGVHEYIADSPMKLRAGLHQLEGSTLKIDDSTAYYSKVNEKIRYIKENFDESKIAIMANYVFERKLLENQFKCPIYSSTSHSEGVDLSHIDTLVIYSMNFSTAKHSQRLARQANIHRNKPIIVHYLLAKDAISDQCYTTVAINKENFVDTYYDRKGLK